jgi:hypothetical protein
VQTSSIAKILLKIEESVEYGTQMDKKMTKFNAPQPEDGDIPLVRKVKVGTIIDKKDKELRFDGATRFMVLPNNRLFILM